MIEVRDVVKSYDGFRALDGLCLSAPSGSVYGLVGPNGAGKTTILRHVAGILRQDSGEILVDGEPVYENPGVKKRMAFIPDDIFYFPQATTNSMMNFYKRIYPKFDVELYKKLSEVFQLGADKPIRRLSKGMQKQSAFWLAVCMRPDILVLDEPVDGLDPVMRRQIWSIVLQDVAEYGTTVLISSHNLRELEDVCDRVGIMDKGRMLLERSLSDMQENIAKIQIAMPDGASLPEGLQIVHTSGPGRLKTLIVRGQSAEIKAVLEAAGPLFMDIVPLTLEEIFVYELGGADYAVKDIIL